MILIFIIIGYLYTWFVCCLWGELLEIISSSSVFYNECKLYCIIYVNISVFKLDSVEKILR